MNLVPLDRLQELCFADSGPRIVPRLRHWARTGRLAGARKVGGIWMCDLDVFRASIEPKASAPAPTSVSFRERIQQLRGVA